MSDPAIRIFQRSLQCLGLIGDVYRDCSQRGFTFSERIWDVLRMAAHSSLLDSSLNREGKLLAKQRIS
eukprot:767895-Hanusia_phi.AAC.17